jgi:hypothetical protein
LLSSLATRHWRVTRQGCVFTIVRQVGCRSAWHWWVTRQGCVFINAWHWWVAKLIFIFLHDSFSFVG